MILISTLINQVGVMYGIKNWNGFSKLYDSFSIQIAKSFIDCFYINKTDNKLFIQHRTSTLNLGV